MRATNCLFVVAFATATLACSTTEVVDAAADDGGGADAGTPSPGADGSTPEPAKACTKPSDCPSKVCTAAGFCAEPKANDGVVNGDETDVDCGGANAPACKPLQTCKVATDCTSGVCKDAGQGLLCQEPAPDDGVKNADESDVDCGGAKAPKCADEKTCATRADCASDVCDAGKCKAPAIDGVKNGTETDVDCGGPGAPRCADTLGCLVDGDCTSDVCADLGGGKKCQAPSPTDGKKNGTETDVDCGGLGNPKCATGKTCALHADCTSDGCAYDNTCAERPSCIYENGGRTCGVGGAGGRGDAAWESCCATAPAGAGGVQMNKYKVTAGRMRAFLTRVNGDVRSFVQQARAQGRIGVSTTSARVTSPAAIAGASFLRPEWDLYLPTSLEGNDGAGEISDRQWDDPGVAGVPAPYTGIYTSAYRMAGDTMYRGQNLGLQGCNLNGFGAHTYWMPPQVQADYFGDQPHAHSQAIYDTKALNCVPYLLAQAFCIWDGGRLETFDEWSAAIGPAAYPWGATPAMKGQGDQTYFAFRFPTASDAMLRDPAYMAPAALIPNANQSVERGVFSFSYEWPNLVCGPNFEWCDYSSFMAAPGRTTGRGPWGHADLAGNMMEVTSDITGNTVDPNTSRMAWTTNGSWEGHGFSKTSVSWPNFTMLNKYGKQGLRCVYP